MSRILFINSVCYGSTGSICKNLYKAAEEAGHTCCIAYGRGEAPNGFNTIKIGNNFDIYMHVLKARIFDAMGFGSKRATKELIEKIDEFKPDVIHLHNIHGYYLNIEILFKYLKKHPEIKKIWTLHDCWAFTGHCAYYTYTKCDKWKSECIGNCPNKKEYPKTFFSNIKSNYMIKKKLFYGLKNLTIVTPSKWLRNEVVFSCLKDYPILVINNGIDTNVFKHTESNFKKKYHIEDKKVILGVASVWDSRKGLNTFLELSKEIENEYQIVLIGLSKKQIKELPDNIIGIERTENVNELVKWYSAAEVYFNPTLEDNYPTTNLEAIACGTPVITFNTGGSQESAMIYGNVINNSSIIQFWKSFNSLNNNIKSKYNINEIGLFFMVDTYKKMYTD